MKMKIGIPLTLTLSHERVREKRTKRIQSSFSLDGRRLRMRVKT
jgi:hypothetical protein